jgi:hypothetical protein
VYDIGNEKFLEHFDTITGRFPKLCNGMSNCAAVIHQKKMYVVSNILPNKIEILDLDDFDSGFVEKEFKNNVSLSCGLISVGNFIYMMNGSSVLKFDQDLQIQILAYFEKPFDSFNTTISPKHDDGHLYFFGLENLIKFSITSNSCQVIQLEP